MSWSHCVLYSSVHSQACESRGRLRAQKATNCFIAHTQKVENITPLQKQPDLEAMYCCECLAQLRCLWSLAKCQIKFLVPALDPSFLLMQTLGGSHQEVKTPSLLFSIFAVSGFQINNFYKQ